MLVQVPFVSVGLPPFLYCLGPWTLWTVARAAALLGLVSYLELEFCGTFPSFVQLLPLPRLAFGCYSVEARTRA